VSPSIPPTPADLERLAGLLRHDLTGAEVVVLPSPYSAEPRGAVRVRLGHRAFLDLADDGASWFVAGLWSDQGGETPPAERRHEALAVPLQAEAAVVATAVVASVWRWVEAIGPQEADAPFTRTSRSAPPAIPDPAVFGAPAPAPYATAAAPAPHAPYASSAPAAPAAPTGAWSAPSARPPRRRRGLLIGGLVAAGLLVLAGGAAAAVTLAHSVAEVASASRGTEAGPGDGADGPGRAAPSAPAPGSPEEAAEMFPSDLVDGDCFGFPPEDDGGEGIVGTVELQSCDDEHDYETYALVPAPEQEWPGDDALTVFAEDACTTEFETFVGLPWADSVVDLAYLQPTVDGWADGQRNVLCYAWIEGDTSPGTLGGYGY
jgi:hypothetical protein